MFSIDLKIVHFRPTCNTYPPIIRIIAFSGLENIIIKLTCGEARLLPTITRAANGIHAYSALLNYPFTPIQTPSKRFESSAIMTPWVIEFDCLFKQFTTEDRIYNKAQVNEMAINKHTTVFS